MSRARDNANLGAQAGSGLDASDITSGALGASVTGGAGLGVSTAATSTFAPKASPTFTGTVAIPNVANLETAVVANTAKATNVTTNLAITGSTDGRTITSSDGTDALIPVATTSVSGVMSTGIFDAVALNTAKVTNSTNASDLASGTVAVARGGTGVTTSTGTGSVMLSAAPNMTGSPTKDGNTMAIWYHGSVTTGNGAGTITVGASNHRMEITFKNGNRRADIFHYGNRLNPGTWSAQGIACGHGAPVFYSGSFSVSDGSNTYGGALSGGVNQINITRTGGADSWDCTIKYFHGSQ